MRSAGDIVNAITRVENGFKLITLLDKNNSEEAHKNYVLAWDDGDGYRREVHCNDSSLDFEKQCEEILCVLSCTMQHDFEKNYGWLPKFSSIEELDLKLKILGV